VTPDDALQVLGLTRPVAWPDIQARHRTLIRTEHPDAGGDPAKAAALNQALEVLAGAWRGPGAVAAPVDGRPPPPPLRSPSPPVLDGDVDRLLRLDVAPDELLLRFAEAGHALGEVVFVDPQAGLLEIVVGDRRDAAQLAVTVGPAAEGGVRVAFMLEPLASGGRPPAIDAVVDGLVAAVRRLG
jgi:hypothetical protein